MAEITPVETKKDHYSKTIAHEILTISSRIKKCTEQVPIWEAELVELLAIQEKLK